MDRLLLGRLPHEAIACSQVENAAERGAAPNAFSLREAFRSTAAIQTSRCVDAGKQTIEKTTSQIVWRACPY